MYYLLITILLMIMSLNNNSADHFSGKITIVLVSGKVLCTGHKTLAGGAIYVQDSSPLVYPVPRF